MNYDDIRRHYKSRLPKKEIPTKRFDCLRIEAVSKSMNHKTTLIAKSLEDAKERFGDKFKDFKILGWKDELDSKKHKAWEQNGKDYI